MFFRGDILKCVYRQCPKFCETDIEISVNAFFVILIEYNFYIMICQKHKTF